MWTATMHIFCAVVGAGVLALPSSVAWIGWGAGPLLIVLFYLTSLMSSQMLANCYQSRGEDGQIYEHARYHHAVRHLLGQKSSIAVSVFQLLNIFLTCIAYTITGAGAAQSIAQMACSNPNPEDCTLSKSSGGIWIMTLSFGAVELILSQVKNLEDAWWVSTIGTVGSLVYALIALILGLISASNGLGNVDGIPVGYTIYDGTEVSTADKVFGILNALGAIGFAFNFSLILLEIQDTLRQPPKASRTMKKSCTLAITTSFVFYVTVACAGYAAKGNDVAPMILDSFDGPEWALIIANVAVLAHMVTAFQVFGQAMFNTLESHFKWRQIKNAAKKAATTSDAIKTQATPAVLTDGAEKGTTVAAAAKAVAPASTPAMAASPFDAPTASGEAPSQHHFNTSTTKMMGFNHVQLEPLAERLSSLVSGEVPMDSHLSSVIEHLHSFEAEIETRMSSGGHLRPRVSMYAADTGFANEEVPLNDEHYYLPLWQRLIIRSVYVLLITLIACIMPFFGAMAGLVGAVTYFPLTVYFPFALYRIVKGDAISKGFSMFLWVVWVVLLAVAISATVGSVRSIIVSWSTFTLFGT
jgi:amino acid permease